MKRYLKIILSVSIVLIIGGALAFNSKLFGNGKEHIPNSFPLEEKLLNEILAYNKLDWQAKDLQTVKDTKELKTDAYLFYEVSQESEKVPPMGTISFNTGEKGKSVTVQITSKDPAYDNITQEDVEKILKAACDIYGGFENTGALYGGLKNDMANNKYEVYDDRVFLYKKVENVNCLVDFTYRNEADFKTNDLTKLTFKGVMIMDKNALNNSISNNKEQGKDWVKYFN